MGVPLERAQHHPGFASDLIDRRCRVPLLGEKARRGHRKLKPGRGLAPFSQGGSMAVGRGRELNRQSVLTGWTPGSVGTACHTGVS